MLSRTLLSALLMLAMSSTLAARSWVYFEQLPRTGEFAGSDRTAARLLRAGVDPDALLNQCVDPVWLAELQQQGAVIHNVSRWLNAISIADDPELINRLSTRYQIRAVRQVQTYHRSLPVLYEGKQQPACEQTAIYGDSWTQLAQMGVPTLHEMGYTGTGVFIGMLDTGWQLGQHDALSHADIVATWDFYNDDSNVEYEDGDHSSQDRHGTSTLGCIAAWAPYNLIGVAYDASFALAKTEHIGEEINAEEDDFVAGLEWLDSLGVDIASSSLGYSRFDEGEDDYTVDDLDGDICITTVACDLAAARGIFVVTSAGNKGGSVEWHGLITSPADGDSVMAVGAVAGDSTIVGFSSRGPTADGRIKPDFCAMGLGTWVIDADLDSETEYRSGSGTSYAGPLLAGAAALLLQRNPEILPLDLAALMKANASHSAAPDTAYGWGIVDLPRVLGLLEPPIQLEPDEVRVYPNPFTTSLGFLIENEQDELFPVRVKMYDLLGRIVYNEVNSAVQGERITIYPPATLADGIYFAMLIATETGQIFGQAKCIKLEY